LLRKAGANCIAPDNCASDTRFLSFASPFYNGSQS